MITIYKYAIEEDKENELFYINVPKGAEVISALAMSPMSGYIYAIVDNEEKEMERREVIWYGTGWPVDLTKVNSSNYQFLGTFKQEVPHLASFVWHVWVEKEKIDFINVFNKLLC